MTGITIYTDGGCWPNPGKGGWGALLIFNSNSERREIFGGDEQTTNNRMEITAVLMALRELKERTTITLYSDSKYVINGAKNWMKGWKRNGWVTGTQKGRKPVMNRDLWEALDAEIQRHSISWQWVKGHNGNAGNERADELAAKGAGREVVNDQPYGQPMKPMAVGCPYCMVPAILVDSAEIYHGRSYGLIYLCRPCEAWVGVHKGTAKPLGRLANKELREWKQKAHATFDPIWRRKYEKRKAGYPGSSEHPGGETYLPVYARSSGYKWLAGELGIDAKLCHIGMFDIEMCKRVVDICAPIVERLRSSAA